MGRKHPFLWGFILAVLLFSACTQRAKKQFSSTLHIYSDVLSEDDEDLFENFEKVKRIDVRVHCLSFAEIQKKLAKNRYTPNMDVIVLSRTQYFEELYKRKLLFKPQFTKDKWQPLALDPLVFKYHPDSTAEYTTYGQIMRSEGVMLVPSPSLKSSFQEETKEQLTRLYSDQSERFWREKVWWKDTLRPKKTEFVDWVYHSELKPTDFRFSLYPDQHYKGAIGRSIGLGIIYNCSHLDAATDLYAWCEKEQWRKNFARRLGVFGILEEEANRQRYPYLFQQFSFHK